MFHLLDKEISLCICIILSKQKVLYSKVLCSLVSQVGKALVYGEWGSGVISGLTNTQRLKNWEEDATFGLTSANG